MIKHTLKTLFLVTLSLTFTTSVQASEHAGGFVSGFTHPILGFDHLLAMISVGVLSVQIGGRALYVVPASFLGLMLFGSVIGLFGIPLMAVETNIALSVLMLGLAIAFDKKTPLIWSMLFVGFFAIFHGYAHSLEIPELAEPVQYAGGFLLATTLLHIVGVAIGEGIKFLPKSSEIIRLLGAGVAGAGVYILYSLTSG